MTATKIEWAEESWNPLRGCTRVSEGCRNCYAERVASRFSGPGLAYDGLATKNPPRWTGEVRLIEDKLAEPLRRRKPTRWFVNSMSDLFHERVPDAWIDRIFAVMALAPHHQFLVLTKRPERMRAYFELPTLYEDVLRAAEGIRRDRPRLVFIGISNPRTRPLPNVWLGVSAEDQATADARIPLLLQTPAAVRWVSAEPLLGPVDFRVRGPDKTGWWIDCPECVPRGYRGTRPARAGEHGGFDCKCDRCEGASRVAGINWLVVGGESGSGARPCEVEWVESIRDQCVAAGVPLFVKQDSGATPGKQGRLSDDLWTHKAFPEAARG